METTTQANTIAASRHLRNTSVRWAAIGAAVAVSLGAGGVGISHALVTSGERTVYVPITPCRLADTRPGVDNVGAKNTPLGPAASYVLSGHGSHGECVLPTTPAGLALNVTAIGATAPTFLTIFPHGITRPLASHLNPVPGEPPTPNAVNVDLDGTGQFDIFNQFGSVDVVVDVVGYYEDHNHDDRYYTETEVDSSLALKADAADVYTKTETDTLIEGVQLETIVTPLVGSPAPTLTPGPLSSVTAFTTTSAGRLLASRAYNTSYVCALGTAYAYLVVDGAGLASTVTPISGVSARYTFTGLTSTLVAAGPHTLQLGLECVGGTPSLPAFGEVGSTSIVVIPASS